MLADAFCPVSWLLGHPAQQPRKEVWGSEMMPQGSSPRLYF